MIAQVKLRFPCICLEILFFSSKVKALNNNINNNKILNINLLFHEWNSVEGAIYSQ